MTLSRETGSPLSVLHIDTGMTFRGGQRQLLLLSNRLRDLGLRQVIACPEAGELYSRVTAVPVIGLPIHPLVRKLHIRPLRRVIKELGINLIHAHDSDGHTLGILLKSVFPNVKLIVSRRVVFAPSGPISRRLKYRRIVDHFIAISRAVANTLTEAGVASNNITVIHSGLDIETIKQIPRDEAVRREMPGDIRFLIASAGALTSEKDFETALKTVEIVLQEVKGVGMVILGEGPERPKLERLIKDRGLDCVRLLGFREPMAPVFKASDIFLLTSSSEGLNSSAIEAAACGLPLVVSDVGGLPEIAENGNNGIVCPTGKPEAFAAAIVDLFRDDAKRGRLAANSLAVAERFDAGHTARETAALYERVFGRRP